MDGRGLPWAIIALTICSLRYQLSGLASKHNHTQGNREPQSPLNLILQGINIGSGIGLRRDRRSLVNLLLLCL